MSAEMTADASPDMPVVGPCPSSGGGTRSEEVHGWTVRVDERSGAWSVTLPNAKTLDGAPGCSVVDAGTLSGVRVSLGEPFVRYGLGSFRFSMAVDSMKWVEQEGAVQEIRRREDALEIIWPLEMPGETVSLVFSPQGEGDLRVELATSLPGATGGELQWQCQPEEAFFGLGSQTWAMDLRGGSHPMFTQEHGLGKPENGRPFPAANIPEAAHAPMGVWHSSLGYSGVLTHDAYSEFDACKTWPGRVGLRSYQAMPGFVLVAGETPRERVSQVTTYVGRLPTTPPAWLFAPWNDAVDGPSEIARVAAVLRDNDIPSSAIWTEDWIGSEPNFTGFRLTYDWSWDVMAYPDLPADIERLHALGFAFLGYFNTFVPDTQPTYEEGVQGGYLVKNEEGEVYTQLDPGGRTTALIDLSNPQARDWMKGYMRTAALELGLDGWMADFSEWLPVDARMSDGASGWAYHNRYPVEYQRLNQELMQEVHSGSMGGEAENNWVFFPRSGWASVNGGTPGQTLMMWGADQNTDWGYDDGLPTILPLSMHLGMSGVPIFGSDIAGYSNFGAPLSTKELFLRWSSVGAMHPVMRTHHGSTGCGNWSFDRDPETLAHYRRWASIHTLLYPYFRARSTEAEEKGWPITRHPYFVYPDRPELWQAYVMFVGDDLLVAPVLEEGETSVSVTLPGAGWWPLFGDAPLEDAMITAQAVATELPVFVRPGTALGMLGEVVDSFYGATQADILDLEDVRGHHRVGLYPDASGGTRPLVLGGATITSSGWNTGVDWSDVTVNGQPWPECVGEVSRECVSPADRTVYVEGTELEVKVGAASVGIRGPQGRYRVALGGAVFGGWAEPTALTELESMAPPTCPVAD